MWRQLMLTQLLCIGGCVSVDVLGGRTTRTKDDSSASTVVSILIPTILGIAVVVFCIVCYCRKRKEKKLQSDNNVSASERIKENALTAAHTYQNTSTYEYGTPRMALPKYDVYEFGGFSHDNDPPPYSETRSYPLHSYDNPDFQHSFNEPSMLYDVHPQFDPHPTRLSSRYNRDDSSIRSQYSDNISQQLPDFQNEFANKHYNTRYHTSELPLVDSEPARFDNFNSFEEDEDLRPQRRTRLSCRGRHESNLSHRTNSFNSSQSFDHSNPNSMSRTSSRQRLQTRPSTHEEHRPFPRTRSRSSHRHRLHHHRNSLKLHQRSALRRSKSFHGNQKKSVRFSGNLEDFDEGQYGLSPYDADENYPETGMYRTRSLPNLRRY